jgi:hypothetical protein
LFYAAAGGNFAIVRDLVEGVNHLCADVDSVDYVSPFFGYYLFSCRLT